MSTINKKLEDYTKSEMTVVVMRMLNTSDEDKARAISNDIVNIIDWNNSALMHKGLSWMAKNYLIKKNMI